MGGEGRKGKEVCGGEREVREREKRGREREVREREREKSERERERETRARECERGMVQQRGRGSRGEKHVLFRHISPLDLSLFRHSSLLDRRERGSVGERERMGKRGLGIIGRGEREGI